MKILYEDTMPHGRAYFSQLGEVQAYSWQQLRPQHLRDVDVLAVRSTTKITSELLSQANKLKLIATATAGTNHLNIPLLEQKGIDWYAAAGCNADAVAQYVVSAIMYAHEQQGLDYRAITVGIVGAGHVGTALSSALTALGIAHVLCDPPIENGDPRDFVRLEQALECEVVSLHVPLVKEGAHATLNMLNAKRLANMRPTQWLINACRGEVVDEKTLLRLKQDKQGPKLVLDVWLNEPNINTQLIPYVDIATAHIAGHTDEGKIRGTQMVYDHIQSYANLVCDKQASLQLSQFLASGPQLDCSNHDASKLLSRVLLSAYDIKQDHDIFVQTMALGSGFSKLRKSYQGRREYSAFHLTDYASMPLEIKHTLSRLGFTI